MQAQEFVVQRDPTATTLDVVEGTGRGSGILRGEDQGADGEAMLISRCPDPPA